MFKNVFLIKSAILAVLFVAVSATGAQQPVSIQLKQNQLTELMSHEAAKKWYADWDYAHSAMVRMVPVAIFKEGKHLTDGLLPHSFFSKPPQSFRFNQDGDWMSSEISLPDDIIEQISHKISCEQLIEKALTKSVFGTIQQDVKSLKDELKSLNENIATVFRNQNKIGNSQNYWLVEQLIRAITPISTALTVAYIVHKDAVKECTSIALIVTIGAIVVYMVHCNKESSTAFWKRH